MLQPIYDLLHQILGEVRPLANELAKIRRRFSAMQADIDAIKAAVAKQTTVTSSAVTLLQTLSQRLNDALDDPDELRRIVADIDQNAQTLAAAVSANTPAANEPAQTGTGGAAGQDTTSGASGSDTTSGGTAVDSSNDGFGSDTPSGGQV